MFSKRIHIVIFTLTLFIGVTDVTGQKRRNKRPAGDKPDASVVETAKGKEPQVKTEQVPAKKNSRGTETSVSAAAGVAQAFTHFYEFSQPDFTVKRVLIRHDDNGKGEISFLKNGSDETITEPIELSKTTLERIAATLAELDFLNSTETYQHDKDYSHLGNIKFTLKTAEKSRTAAYNWTVNKGAKALMDEYRRISHQYIWMFDIGVARQNQPLEAPKMLESLDGYIRRGEISDPVQMIIFLKGLSDDERIPLIARNHAEKLVKQIEKNDKKNQ